MAKTQIYYQCSNCGNKSLKYMGKCSKCQAWNTFEEVIEEPEPKAGSRAAQVLRSLPEGFRSEPQRLGDVSTDQGKRIDVPVGEFSRVLGGGIVPGSIILVGGEPGIGKCVTADTRIFDPVTGDYLPITAWASGDRHVLSTDTKTLKLGTDKVHTLLDQGVRPIVEVTTRLGRVLRCTPDHPVLTSDGWTPVSALSAGSRIAAPRALPYFGTEKMTNAEVMLLGYILSDSSAGDQISVTNMLPEVQKEFLKRMEVLGINASNKFVPKAVFRLPEPHLVLFLKCLFTCAGSVYVSQAKDMGISYATISKRLAQDVQHLLLRFGLVAKLRTKNQRYKGQPYTSYELTLNGVRDTRTFLDRIGIEGHHYAKQVIHQSSDVELFSTHKDTVHTADVFWAKLNQTRVARAVPTFAEQSRQSRQSGVFLKDRRHDRPCHDRPLVHDTVQKIAWVLDDPVLTALGVSDLYWDEIESIAPAGEAPVYDLSVANRHNFVANDLIIHNSTLLLQVAVLLAQSAGKVLYISGEESTRQIKMRAERLGLSAEDLFLVTETSLETILDHVQKVDPTVMIVDSIQTTYSDDKPSSAGTVSQIRECAARLQMMAKTTGISIFLVGHVTKEGTIAGPRVLEHIVDTVLYLEGDPFHAYRLLRSVKNRFGATNEVGVFEMREAGMVEVTNPSEAFLAERMQNASGSGVVVTMEGTRPLVVEVQALVSPTSYPNPRRTGNGIDFNRLQLVTAVLTRRLNLRLAEQDIFVNVIGGITIDEPAADLAIALAVASSLWDRAIPPDLVIIGELGLSGELRSVGQLAERMREAAKLGFKRCLIPKGARSSDPLPKDIEAIPVRSILDAIRIAIPGDRKPAPSTSNNPARASAIEPD